MLERAIIKYLWSDCHCHCDCMELPKCPLSNVDRWALRIRARVSALHYLRCAHVYTFYVYVCLPALGAIYMYVSSYCPRPHRIRVRAARRIYAFLKCYKYLYTYIINYACSDSNPRQHDYASHTAIYILFNVYYAPPPPSQLPSGSPAFISL